MDYIGSYRIIEESGSGAFGVVYKAYQPFLDRQVAIKTLRTLVDANSKNEQQFMAEARTIARLRHANIVSVYEFGSAPIDGKNTTFMVMEFLAGQTLFDRMAQRDLNFNEILQIAEELADALDYAHDKGIIHRDLKPANVIFSESGHAVIVDFGLARLVKLGASNIKASAQDAVEAYESTMSGTPAYMSPEQVEGKAVQAPSDQYALATIIYEMLAGQLPFKSGTLGELLAARISESPIPITELVPEFSSELDYVLERALARNPEDRYPNCREFVRELGAALLPNEFHSHVQTVVDPLQAAALRAARQSIRGFLWGMVALTVVATLLCWSLMIRGYNQADEEFLSDGIHASFLLNENGRREILGIFPNSPADLAGLSIGDEIDADVALDRRDTSSNFTVNGIERSIFGANWQPQLGDVIERPVYQGNEVRQVSLVLDRDNSKMLSWVIMIPSALLCFGLALWVLRRWGDEPNGHIFTLVILAQSFTVTALGVFKVFPSLSNLMYYLLLGTIVHFMLMFPNPLRRIERHPRLILLIYLPFPFAFYQFLTGELIMIDTLDVNLFVYLAYTALIFAVMIFKWFRRDLRLYPPLWWIVLSHLVMGSLGAFAIYLTLTGEFSDRLLENTAYMNVGIFLSLSLATSLFILMHTIGFHRIQKMLGPSLITQASQASLRLGEEG